MKGCTAVTARTASNAATTTFNRVPQLGCSPHTVPVSPVIPANHPNTKLNNNRTPPLITNSNSSQQQQPATKTSAPQRGIQPHEQAAADQCHTPRHLRGQHHAISKLISTGLNPSQSTEQQISICRCTRTTESSERFHDKATVHPNLPRLPLQLQQCHTNSPRPAQIAQTTLNFRI